MTYYNGEVDERALGDAIVQHVSAVAGHNRVYAHMFRELQENNWRNHVMDGLISTGMETLEVWSHNRRTPKSNLLQEVVRLICDIQSVVSAQRSREIMSSVTHAESQAFAQITQIGQQFNAEIEHYYQQRQGYNSPYGTQPSNQPINPRYAKRTQANYVQNVPGEVTPVSNEVTTTASRYRPQTATATTPASQPQQANNNSSRLYVVSNKGKSGMSSDSTTLVYANHRRDTFQPRPSSPKPAPDFMGALATEHAVVGDVPDNDISDVAITTMATDLVATCREHAQAIFNARITDAGNTVSTDTVVEYSYDEVRALRTLVDNETLRMAILNDSRLGDLRDIKSDLGEFAAALGNLIADPVNTLANIIGRHINLHATEQINRFLKYDLELTWQVPDFQAAWNELLAELQNEFGEDKIDGVLKTVGPDIILKSGTVFMPTKDTDESLCQDLNAIYQTDLAERTAFVLRQIHVTHIPADLSALNVTFEGTECLVDPSKAPELYKALMALETRLNGGMRTYSKIILVTQDEVDMEVIPTHIDTMDKSGNVVYALKLLKA